MNLSQRVCGAVRRCGGAAVAAAREGNYSNTTNYIVNWITIQLVLISNLRIFCTTTLPHSQSIISCLFRELVRTKYNNKYIEISVISIKWVGSGSAARCSRRVVIKSTITVSYIMNYWSRFKSRLELNFQQFTSPLRNVLPTSAHLRPTNIPAYMLFIIYTVSLS